MLSCIIYMHSASDSGIDNPTYDERQGASTLNNTMVNVIHDESEREFENPDEIIDTLRIDPTNSADSQLQSTSHYERVHLESATVNEILYESADIGVFQAAQVSLDGRGPDNTNGIEASYGDVMKGATSSEGVYELPPNMDGSAAGGDLDESCYSTLNPTYAQLQAHIGAAKPGPETQNQHNDSDYSHLKF